MPRYDWNPDMDRSTAGERVPISGMRRHEFADGVFLIPDGRSTIEVPAVPRPPDPFMLALARRDAYLKRQKVIRRRMWIAVGWVALVLGAVLMVAVTHG